jgi:non-homologous end joining protein Ku
MRKLIEFEDETYQALTQLAHDRMGTLRELADEAFRDLLKKHGVPIDLKDALQRSVKASGPDKHHARTSKAKSSNGKIPTATMKRRALKFSAHKHA